jgi:hypothetical protein
VEPGREQKAKEKRRQKEAKMREMKASVEQQFVQVQFRPIL